MSWNNLSFQANSSLLAAGTAILCKHKPLSVKHDFPTHPEGEAAAKGRLIALEYSTVWIVGTYVPNAGQNLKVILAPCSLLMGPDGEFSEYALQGCLE